MSKASLGQLGIPTFPWRTIGSPWQTRSDKEDSSADKKQAAKQDQERRLERPGLILFRKNQEPPKKQELLAVFLVGERPTFGVNRVAFRAALSIVEQMSPDNPRIYLIGPSFSGSLPRLSQLLSDSNLWEGLQRKKFIAVSGQATSAQELEKFRLSQAGTLCTTVHDDRYAIRNFLSYLRPAETGGRPDVALLSEDETAYGHEFQPQTGEEENSQGRVLMVRYPRGIARLRNTTNEIPNIGTTSSSSSHDTVPQLPLILKETGEDVIKTFSQQQTPVSNEAVLVNIAGMLRRNQIRYIGVLATDPLDTLFLVRFLRAACPDVQLVIFSSDLLFARVSHNWSLEGLLTVTTYPLFIENQDYMEPQNPPRRISFPSAYAEGVYNATRWVLLQWEPRASATDDVCDLSPVLNPGLNTLLEYASPFPDSQSSRADSRHDSKLTSLSQRTPPLWLTILGHDSFWPVALIGAERDDHLISKGPGYRNSHNFLPEKPSLLWYVLFGLIALHSVGVLLIILVMNPSHTTKIEGQLSTYSLFRNFSLNSRKEQGAARAVNLLIIVITVAIVNALFLLTFSGFAGWWGFKGFCSVTLLIAAVESLWMTGILIKPKTPGDVKILALFSWVTGIWCLWELALTSHGIGAVHTIDFFAYRALHPESGVSPILPALVLAISYHYWAVLQLRRLRWVEERQPSTVQNPCNRFRVELSNIHSSGTVPDNKPWIIPIPRFLPKEIESVFGTQTGFLALPLMGLWVFLSWKYSGLSSIEPVSYQFFFELLLVVGYGMLIGNWVRFLFLWKDLSQLLQSLESHPLRDAFSRLPDDFSWTSIWRGSLQPQLITLTRSHDCLLSLASNNICLLRRDELKAISENLRLFDDEQQLAKDRLTAFEAVEKSYASAAWEAGVELQNYWRRGNSDSLAEHEKTLAPAALSTEVRTRWLLEEFMALRYCAYIRYVLQQMRNFLEFVTTAFILLAVTSVAYPFQGRHSLATSHLILFLILGTGVAVVFLRMDRDPLLSRLSGSKPNKVGFDFVWRLLSYGSIPLLTLLGSQFPSVRDFLFSWVQPALQAIK